MMKVVVRDSQGLYLSNKEIRPVTNPLSKRDVEFMPYDFLKILRFKSIEDAINVLEFVRNDYVDYFIESVIPARIMEQNS